jgi:hypothetical protein
MQETLTIQAKPAEFRDWLELYSYDVHGYVTEMKESQVYSSPGEGYPLYRDPRSFEWLYQVPPPEPSVWGRWFWSIRFLGERIDLGKINLTMEVVWTAAAVNPPNQESEPAIIDYFRTLMEAIRERWAKGELCGELNEARSLLKRGSIRSAGAVAGVALEAYLKLLHDQSDLSYTDKDSIVPLAARLRKNNIISLGDEKKCIAMADTRNKCDHKKGEEPTEAEVRELVDDVDRFIKRVQVSGAERVTG